MFTVLVIVVVIGLWFLCELLHRLLLVASVISQQIAGLGELQQSALYKLDRLESLSALEEINTRDRAYRPHATELAKKCY